MLQRNSGTKLQPNHTDSSFFECSCFEFTQKTPNSLFLSRNKNSRINPEYYQSDLSIYSSKNSNKKNIKNLRSKLSLKRSPRENKKEISIPKQNFSPHIKQKTNQIAPFLKFAKEGLNNNPSPRTIFFENHTPKIIQPLKSGKSNQNGQIKKDLHQIQQRPSIKIEQKIKDEPSIKIKINSIITPKKQASKKPLKTSLIQQLDFNNQLKEPRFAKSRVLQEELELSQSPQKTVRTLLQAKCEIPYQTKKSKITIKKYCSTQLPLKTMAEVSEIKSVKDEDESEQEMKESIVIKTLKQYGETFTPSPHTNIRKSNAFGSHIQQSFMTVKNNKPKFERFKQKFLLNHP